MYPVNLVASNRHGCLDEAHHDIHIGDRHGLLAQARFSPNGDGHYDTFLPHGLKDMEEAWEMVVVNAKGEEVYRTSDATQPWDGSLPNGGGRGGCDPRTNRPEDAGRTARVTPPADWTD